MICFLFAHIFNNDFTVFFLIKFPVGLGKTSALIGCNRDAELRGTDILFEVAS